MKLEEKEGVKTNASEDMADIKCRELFVWTKERSGEERYADRVELKGRAVDLRGWCWPKGSSGFGTYESGDWIFLAPSDK